MSRIGDNPIVIPDKVEVEIKGREITAKGPNGTLTHDLDRLLKAKQTDEGIVINRINESKKAKQMHGVSRSLVENIVEGVGKGFEKNLEIIGLGYKVEQREDAILLSLGHSHQIYFVPPEGIKLEAETPKRKITAEGTPNQLLTGRIKVSGPDKQLVGQVAAKIRSFRKPDVYKSKGVRYVGERIHIKAGKAAV